MDGKRTLALGAILLSGVLGCNLTAGGGAAPAATATMPGPPIPPTETLPAPATDDEFPEPGGGFRPATSGILEVSFSYPAELTLVEDPATNSIGLWKTSVTGQTQRQALITLAHIDAPDAFITAALAMQPGDTLAPDPIPFGGPEYHQHTFVDTITLDGYSGVIIENALVWEATPETRHRRVIVSNGTRTYEISAFYETPEMLSLFEVLLGTVDFFE